MSAQPSLFSQRSPRPSDQDVTILCGYLSMGAVWQRRRALPAPFNEDRYVRAVAEASGGRVIGSQRGYALVKRLTQDEYEEAVRPLLKAIRTAKGRIADCDRAFYGSRQQRPEAA